MNVKDDEIPDDRFCFHGNHPEYSLRHSKSAAKEIIGLRVKGLRVEMRKGRGGVTERYANQYAYSFVLFELVQCGYAARSCNAGAE